MSIEIKEYSYKELKEMIKINNDLESLFYDLLNLCTNEVQEDYIHSNLHKIECINLREY